MYSDNLQVVNILNRMKKILFFLPILYFLTSCSHYSISYNHNRINKKENLGFEILLNKKKINSRLSFLDKKNIEKVYIDKKQKQIQITQKDTTSKFFRINEVFGKAIQNKNPKEIGVVIIDGIPFRKNYYEAIQIEINSIKSMTFIRPDRIAMVSCWTPQGDYLVIQTKQ